MQVNVNTDAAVTGREAVVAQTTAAVVGALSRFADGISRVEVHLGDANGAKSGSADKRCMVEARPNGQQPVAVTHHAATLAEAQDGALAKLARLLETKFGKLHSHKGAPSIRDNDLR